MFVPKNDEDKPIPKHVPTAEEREVEKLYFVLLKDGWVTVGGNQWSQDGEKGSFLIIMKKGDEVRELRSLMPLSIVNSP